MYAKFMSYLAGEKGASMVEYSLLVLLIAIVALVAVTVAGSELSETYSEISSNLSEAGP
jgi:Flp pilus assembly pilin Flp